MWHKIRKMLCCKEHAMMHIGHVVATFAASNNLNCDLVGPMQQPIKAKE